LNGSVHFSSGTSAFLISAPAEIKRRGFKITALEIADSNYASNRQFPIIDYDGKQIPLSDASADIVFFPDVLEHVPGLAQTAVPQLILRALPQRVELNRLARVWPHYALYWWTAVAATLRARGCGAIFKKMTLRSFRRREFFIPAICYWPSSHITCRLSSLNKFQADGRIE
jgi:hypothetical protein